MPPWLEQAGAVIVALLRFVFGPRITNAIVTIVLGVAGLFTVTRAVTDTTDYQAIQLEISTPDMPRGLTLVGGLAYINASWRTLSNAIEVAFSKWSRGNERRYLRRFQDSLLSPAETVAAVIQSQITPEAGRENLLNYGYPPDIADKLVGIAGEPLAPGQAIDLYNRWRAGLIKSGEDYNLAWLVQNLSESRLKPKYNQAIVDLSDNLLGASDYTRLAVKDAYTTDPALKAVLGEEFPGELRTRLRALGYAEEDAEALWRAHWDLPSPGQVYEMLHRGVLPGSGDIEEVKRYLKQADYDPRWRQALVDISYNVITRTDAKRAYKLGVAGFDEARLLATYKALGYTPADAAMLVEFTRQDVGEEAKQERELLVGPIRTRALSMYASGRITEAEVRNVLANLKYAPDIVDRYIVDVQFTRDADHRDEVAAALKGAYVKALRSREDTLALLVSNGWTPEGANGRLDVWDLLRSATELQPHQAAQRDLTKSELLEAYADRLIDNETVRAGLGHLGYDGNEVDTIVALADYKLQKVETADRVENVHLNYLRGAYDQSSAAIALNELRLPAFKVQNLLMKWEQERAKRVPDFTLAMLEAMVKNKVVDEATAQRFLADQGWLPEQQTLILSLWLGKRVEAAAKAEAKATPKTTTKLARRDYESMYIRDRATREQVTVGLRGLGYTPQDITVILDGIDRMRG